jgi:hypothetical protein
MKRQVIYTRRYIPTPVRIFLWVMFIGVIFLFFFVAMHPNQPRSPNVHTRSHTR